MYQVRIHVLIFTKDQTLQVEELYLIEKIKLKITVVSKPIRSLEVYETADMIVVDGENNTQTLEYVEQIRQRGIPLTVPIVVLVEEGWETYKQVLEVLGVTGYQPKAFAKQHMSLVLRTYIEHISAIKRWKQKDILFNALLNNIPYMSWFKDKDSNYIKVNQAFIEHCGKTEDEIEGRGDFYVWDGNIGKQCRIYDQEVMEKLKSIVFEECIPGRKGRRYFNIYKAPVQAEDGEVIGTVGVARDITDQRVAQSQIEKLAYCDYLTDIGNRRGLYQFIEQIIQGNKEEIAMMFIDLDNFKQLNDIYGHYYGDRGLQLIAQKLQEVCLDAYVSRVGGDEFVVVWEGGISEKWLELKADEILEAIRTIFTKDDIKFVVSASIGIVTGNIKKDSLENILSRGDMALYQAKEGGKGQYVFYTTELEIKQQFNIQIQHALEQALLKNEIVLYYQPQYTTDKKLIGFEALMRWNNDVYRNIPILEIIKLLEASTIITQVGEYVMQQAMKFAKVINHDSKNNLVIWMNISCVQIMAEGFVDRLRELMYDLQIKPEMIGIEITETVLLENTEKNMEKLHILKEMGIKIAIDDFGMEYSSLNYLFRLPLSELKIDKDFVEHIHTKDEHAKLVKLIIDIAHHLQLDVIAEGVECEAQLEILKNMNVEGIQGYLFSKPLSEVEAKKIANR